MSSTQAFAESVIFRLGAYGAASARRMFGGFGIFVDGVMIGLIADDVLYLKADDINKGDFEAAGMGPFTYDRKGVFKKR